MASSVSGKDEPALDWATRAGKMALSDYALCFAKTVCFSTSFYSSPVHKYAKKNLANIQPSWPYVWSITYICFTVYDKKRVSLRQRVLSFMKSRKVKVTNFTVLSYMFLLTNGGQMSWKPSKCLLSVCADTERTCKNMACLMNHPAHQATHESRCS